MAERIGSAYVRVFFRSSGEDLAKDIKDDKGFEKAGTQAAKQTGDGFNSEWTDQLRERMKNDEDYNKKTTTAYKSKMTKLRNDLNKFWEEERRNIDKGINRPFDDLDRDLVKMNNRFRQITANLPDFMELSHDSEDLDRRWQELDKTMQSVAGWAAGIGDGFGNTRRDVDDVGDALNRTDGKGRVFAYRLDTLRRRTERLKSAFEPVGRLVEKVFTPSRLTKFASSMRTVEHSFSRIGKVSETSARNDFFNIIAKSFGGIFNLASKVPAVFAKVAESLGGNVVKPLEEAGKAASTAGEEAAAAGEGVGSSLGSLAAAAPAAIAAIVAIEVVLGFAASAAMLLTGAVIALVAALAVALVGAVAAVYAALLPLAVGIGAVALAFASMDKKSKKVISDAIKPLKKELTDLGRVAERAFVNTLFDTTGKAIQPGRYKNLNAIKEALGSLKPIFRAAGRGLGDFTQEILAGFQSKGFQDFIKAISGFMPEAFRRVGRIAVNVGSFLGSVFEAAIPLAREFLGWLEGLTQSWANLGEGKGGGKIAKFFQDIGPTVDSVGHAIMEVIGLIGDLIAGPAQKEGGNMFQSIADNVHKFRDFLKQAEQDGSLEKFFKDAKRLAGQIGNAVINIGKFIAALDTQDNRDAVVAIAKGFNAVLRATIKVAHWVEFINHWIWKLGGKQIWTAIKSSITAVGTAFRLVAKVAKWAWDLVMKWGQKAHDSMHSLWGSVAGWFAGIGRGIARAFESAWNGIKRAGSAALSYIKNRWNELVTWFHGLGSRLTTAAGWASIGLTIGTTLGNALMTGLSGLPGQIVGLFTGLAGRIVSAIGNIVPHINWPSPPGWFSKLHLAAGGIVAGPTNALIGERGAEAVVPLTGPLNQVDPAVRQLAAFARGMTSGGGQTGRGGRTIDIGGITINTPTQDPFAVATQVVNRVAAASYI